MDDPKVIAVVGATGAQGGGLVRAICANPQHGFRARALTRNPSSDKAKALAELGAEVVAMDLADPSSVQAGFAGAYGAFCVTFFWDHFSVDREVAEVETMAEAAASTGVHHVVWSTLENTRDWVPLEDDRMPTLQGKYKVPHFDGKGEADEIFRRRGVPTTFLRTSFYWDNFIHFGMGPSQLPDGRLGITLPMGDRPLPGIAAEDIGKCALGVFLRPDLIGQTIGIAGEHLTGDQMAAAMTNALGEQIVYNEVPPEVFRSFGFPGADDLGNMFQFKRDFNEDFCGVRNVEFSRLLNPELQSFEVWLAEHADQIPVSKG